MFENGGRYDLKGICHDFPKEVLMLSLILYSFGYSFSQDKFSKINLTIFK